MKAVTVVPHQAGSARFEDFPEPDARDGSVLVEAIAVGVCGTDVEITEGKYGWSPRGADRLVLGHESLGRVLDPGPSSALKAGDLVGGIVRRPDPVPCPNCAVGEWDMCRNGQYTERGIKEIRGHPVRRRVTKPFPWSLFLSEVVGTALLVLGGLSCVILMFGEGSLLPRLLPDAGVRSAITGFLFGTIGASIALSPVGRVSGAHINPAVTFGFWLFGKLSSGTLGVYVTAQLVGASLGSLLLLGWGSMGRSVAFGATVPGTGYSIWTALGGEVVTTFAMVALMCVFIAYRRLRPFTPAIFPPLFSFMVWAESAISGTSCNPARTFGPALISGQWDSWWIYWAGPLAGTFAASLLFSRLARRIEVAKLYHFDSAHDRLARRAGRGAVAMIVVCLCAASPAAGQEPGQAGAAPPLQAGSAQPAKSDSYSGDFLSRSTLTATGAAVEPGSRTTTSH